MIMVAQMGMTLESGVHSHEKMRPGGTFTVTSSSGVPVASVAIKARQNAAGATIVVKLLPAKAGATVTAVNAAAQVVRICEPGAHTDFKFGPFVNGSTTEVVSSLEYEQIGIGEGFLITNNGVSGCKNLPSTMRGKRS